MLSLIKYIASCMALLWWYVVDTGLIMPIILRSAWLNMTSEQDGRISLWTLLIRTGHSRLHERGLLTIVFGLNLRLVLSRLYSWYGILHVLVLFCSRIESKKKHDGTVYPERRSRMSTLLVLPCLRRDALFRI